MPWGDPYGQAICDDCRATTKKVDYTGIQSLRDAGAWCPKNKGGEVILCPKCVMQQSSMQQQLQQQVREASQRRFSYA